MDLVSIVIYLAQQDIFHSTIIDSTTWFDRYTNIYSIIWNEWKRKEILFEVDEIYYYYGEVHSSFVIDGHRQCLVIRTKCLQYAQLSWKILFGIWTFGVRTILKAFFFQFFAFYSIRFVQWIYEFTLHIITYNSNNIEVFNPFTWFAFYCCGFVISFRVIKLRNQLPGFKEWNLFAEFIQIHVILIKM